jgi:quercetin dioxygenase-like cupin family protein
MKLFRAEDFIHVKNPKPGQRFTKDILPREGESNQLAGVFGLLEPKTQVPYHYHKQRHSVIIVIGGEATEIVDGKEIPIKTQDVLYIPPGEKHMMLNKTDTAFRYLEFFTNVAPDDFVEVK